MDSISLARFFVEYLEKAKAKNIQIVQAKSSKIFDYIVVCTSPDKYASQSMLVGLLDFAKNSLNIINNGIEGYKKADWIAIDYGKLQVHIMLEDTRKKYNIEKLWA